MTGATTAADRLAAEMADAETQWSLGTFGAIAEFARDPDEPVELACGPPAFSAVTGRGGIRIGPRPGLRLFAFETTTKESWSPRIAICLPRDGCAMHGRARYTSAQRWRRPMKNRIFIIARA
jgi:hypothetical protein